MSVAVCEGLDYTSNGSSSPGFSVACNLEAGLGVMLMPFLVVNCVTFGLGLVAVLLSRLLAASGRV